MGPWERSVGETPTGARGTRALPEEGAGFEVEFGLGGDGLGEFFADDLAEALAHAVDRYGHGLDGGAESRGDQARNETPKARATRIVRPRFPIRKQICSSSCASFGRARRFFRLRPQDGRCALHCFSDSRVGATPANVALHASNNLFVGWVRSKTEQPDCRNDHSRCAVAALHGARFDEGLLDRVESIVFCQTFDRSYALACDARDLGYARTRRTPVDQHRTSSTLTFAAAVFASSQSQFIAEYFEQVSIGFNR